MKAPFCISKGDGMPYKKIADMLRYKLAMHGIELVGVSEAYTSRTSPKAESVDKGTR